jgi:hypothetical protein
MHVSSLFEDVATIPTRRPPLRYGPANEIEQERLVPPAQKRPRLKFQQQPNAMPAQPQVPISLPEPSVQNPRLQLAYEPPQLPSAPASPPVSTPARPQRPTLSFATALPAMEAEPTAPQFAARKVGVGGRILSGLAGMGMAASQMGNDPTTRGFGAIGGLIAGMANPEAVQRRQFEQGPLTEHQRQVTAVRANNKQRLADFTTQINAQKAVAELNQIGLKKLQPFPGAAVGTLFDPATGEVSQPQVEGKSVPMASVINNQLDEDTRRELAKMKAENEVAKAETAFERTLRLQREKEAAQMKLKLQDMENRLKVLDAQGKQKMGHLRFQEGQRNLRHSIGETGKDKRQAITEAAMDKRAAMAARPVAEPK